MKILYKFPSRERPEKMMAAIDNIRSLSESDDYLIHITMDKDDTKTWNGGVTSTLAGQKNVEWNAGYSTGKIDAINRDMDAITYPWDICVVMSDDMTFTKKGFDNIIRDAFKTHFPDLDGYVHFHDGPYGKQLSGLNIQGRKFYERFGYLYCNEYISLWCDNEIALVSKILGKYVYMGDNVKIVTHQHPSHVKGLVADDLLKKTESYYRIDEETYKRRKARNFDL